MRAEGEAAALRVLLIAELEPGERGLVEALRARGLAVQAVSGAVDALRALREGGADAVILGLPLRAVDPIAACAAVKEGAYAPLLLVGDAADQAASLLSALPERCRPDGVVPRPFEAAKLVMTLYECQQAAGEERSGGMPFELSLAELLIELKRRRANEVLEIRAEGICTAIHLRDGEPIFAEGGSLQETLGRQLVRRGAIGHEDYVRVVARMTEGVIQHQSLRLGEVLVELGLLSPAEVYDALALQVREKIVACFQWERFDYELHEALDPNADLGIYQCPPVEALVLAGIRTHFGPERLAPLLDPHAEQVPVLRRPVDELAPLFQPSAHEQRLLRAIDGARTVRALRAARLLDPVHTDQLLAALCACCALGFRNAPLPAAAREPSPPTPPLRRAATPGAATQAAPAAPPQGAPPAPASAPEPKRAVLGAIPLVSVPQRAFDPLAQLRRRMGLAPGAGASDPRQARLGAEHAFNQGLRMLRDNLLPGALREFRHAVELAPAEPEYRLLEAWLEYRTAPGADARALAGPKVRACAQRALQASRTSARAHSVLGQLALLESDDETAEKHLRLAIHYDAADLDASRGLRLLEKRRRG